MNDFKSRALITFLRKSYFHVIAIIAILSFGCSHTRHIRQYPPTQELDKINEELVGKKVQIEDLAADLKKLVANRIYITADSINYIDLATNTKGRIAISDVYKITVKNRLKGTAEGFGIGLLSYAGLVGASLLLVTAFPDDPSIEDGPGGGILIYGSIVGGAFIPPVFAILGGAIGSRKVYIFNSNE